MTPWIATAISVGGVIVSLITAMATLGKTLNDRRNGITEHEMSTSRFGLESLQASIVVKDALITQLRETVAENRVEIERLKEEIEGLEVENECLYERLKK